MFQQMLNSSRAVLLRPSVASFEEHERNDLGWATIYIAIGAIITALLGAISFVIQRPFLEQQMADLEQQLGGQPLPPFVTTFMGGGGLVVTMAINLLSTLVIYFIWTGFVYLLGRAFGGTGAFGELAYDIALFWAPVSVITSLIGLAGIGPLACLTGLVSLALFIYNIYLSYLSIQAGMNLPSNRALIVILIPILVVVLGCCGLFAVFFAAFSGAAQ
jgi:hypothetical protein